MRHTALICIFLMSSFFSAYLPVFTVLLWTGTFIGFRKNASGSMEDS